MNGFEGLKQLQRDRHVWLTGKTLRGEMLSQWTLAPDED